MPSALVSMKPKSSLMLNSLSAGMINRFYLQNFARKQKDPENTEEEYNFTAEVLLGFLWLDRRWGLYISTFITLRDS